jgi:hypothetical protein
MTMTPNQENIEQKIAKATSFIETAQRLIYQGQAVDLTALQEKTANLCKALTKLPPLETSRILPQVERLFDSIHKLERDIDMQHDALTERLQWSERRANPLMAQEIIDDENKD